MSGKITLKAARVNAGLTQKELAEKIGKSETTIVKWENDQTGKKISIENLEKLCKILNIGFNDIFFN
jgi:cro-like protein, phage associated|nr:MAG TPA: Helix-turn-helix XRE-family like protein [Caudoviricetes sp.]